MQLTFTALLLDRIPLNFFCQTHWCVLVGSVFMYDRFTVVLIDIIVDLINSTIFTARDVVADVRI